MSMTLLMKTKRVIDIAAASEDNGLLRLKLAKLSSGSPMPLSFTELQGFNSYIQQIKFAGTNLTVVSTQADELLLDVVLYYDPQVPLVDVQNAVISTVETFVFSLPFDGKLSLDSLEQTIANIEGITQVVLNGASARPNGIINFAAFRRLVYSYRRLYAGQWL